MHDDDNPRCPFTTTHEEDDRTEAAILGLVLEEHPAQLTHAELTLRMVGPNPDTGDADAIDRGVRDLTGTGLLHCNGDTIRPTYAALRFHDLLIER
ncbi:MAG TPA: hypothetical protein VKB23_03075 [Solirubrobacterales bacterium]|nr:hypothetical protein [Solirubrobacterales bacterium]